MFEKFIQKDASFIAEKSLPAAGASASTDALDLAGGGGLCELEIAVESLTALVATKSLVLKIQECATVDGDYTDAAWAGQQTITGKTGNRADAFAQRIGVPYSAKRYIKLTATAGADAGDNTAKKFKLSALF